MGAHLVDYRNDSTSLGEIEVQFRTQECCLKKRVKASNMEPGPTGSTCASSYLSCCKSSYCLCLRAELFRLGAVRCTRHLPNTSVQTREACWWSCALIFHYRRTQSQQAVTRVTRVTRTIDPHHNQPQTYYPVDVLWKMAGLSATGTEIFRDQRNG